MKLYHFTSGNALRGIARHGLTVGDVPTNIRKLSGRIGVWLTSSDDPNGHGVGSGQIDKKRVRLTVDVPDKPARVHWLEWSKENVTEETRDLAMGADGDRKSVV